VRPDDTAHPPLVCVLGPTGAGKTEAAIKVAEAVGGAVVNFDSRQIYRDLPLITAQPSPEELARCPHRLYGFAPLERKIGAGEYARLLEAEVASIRAQGLVPILTGGTGLYLRAFLQGLAEIPEIPEAVRRAVAEDMLAHGPQVLHQRLGKVDPDYAARVAPADRQRVSRALEVYLATGRPLSAWHADQKKEGKSNAAARPAIKAGLTLTLAELAPRLAARIRAMIEAGAADEVGRAFAAHPDERAPSFSGIGCPELLAYARGEMNLEETSALWLKNTRAYAKRQITWFKREVGVAWFAPSQTEELAGHILRLLDSLRKGNGKTS